MPISERQLEKLNNWFKSKNINMSCPSCGHNAWSAADIVVAPKFERGIVIGGPAVPMIQLICNHCAYVRSYAAIPIGLLEKETQETKEPEEEERRRR